MRFGSRAGRSDRDCSWRRRLVLGNSGRSGAPRRGCCPPVLAGATAGWPSDGRRSASDCRAVSHCRSRQPKGWVSTRARPPSPRSLVQQHLEDGGLGLGDPAVLDLESGEPSEADALAASADRWVRPLFWSAARSSQNRERLPPSRLSELLATGRFGPGGYVGATRTATSLAATDQ
jgi:hypothetical protein